MEKDRLGGIDSCSEEGRGMLVGEGGGCSFVLLEFVVAEEEEKVASSLLRIIWFLVGRLYFLFEEFGVEVSRPLGWWGW